MEEPGVLGEPLKSNSEVLTGADYVVQHTIISGRNPFSYVESEIGVIRQSSRSEP
jgi:hypothetical protein